MKLFTTKEIGINGSMLDEQPTGVGVYSFNLINHLSVLEVNGKLGMVTVFAPTKLFLHSHINVVKLPGLLLSSRYGKMAAFSRFLWNTFAYPLQARNYKLLVSPTTHGSFLLKNQIITVHDLISLHFDNISAHQRFYFRRILPFLLARAKLIIAVSETTRQDIIRFFGISGTKIRVIYNGYDNSRYLPLQDKSNSIQTTYGCRNYFLAVGPTYRHKNFEFLIEAYHVLPETVRKNHPLLIAGGKPAYIRLLQQMTHRLGLSGNIVFAGYIPAQLMPDLYREAYLLIFPSLYEGFGIPLLKAMGSGCPVIASNAASMPEVCGDAVLYIDPLSSSSLVDAIHIMVTDSRTRQNFIERGLKRAGQFSWHKMAAEFQAVIETSLNENKS